MNPALPLTSRLTLRTYTVELIEKCRVHVCLEYLETRCLSPHLLHCLLPWASLMVTWQLEVESHPQGLSHGPGWMGEPCSQGPRTHLQPRNSQCIQNQLTTSMMREMGKLKRNQVPKLTTSAAGYWLEGKEPGQWLEKGGFPCSILGGNKLNSP